eukprot:jgi/Bigna1/90187/estExt_fgenesh1_pg.C_640082
MPFFVVFREVDIPGSGKMAPIYPSLPKKTLFLVLVSIVATASARTWDDKEVGVGGSRRVQERRSRNPTSSFSAIGLRGGATGFSQLHSIFTRNDEKSGWFASSDGSRLGFGFSSKRGDDTAKENEEGSVTLKWYDISLTLKSKKSMEDMRPYACAYAWQWYDRNHNAYCKSGRFLGIMGPSGAGKTTLLNALAGRVPASKNVALSGEIERKGDQNSPFAFVPQDDVFYSQMTVWETLMFTAELRLPKKMSFEEKKQRAEDVMTKLGLAKAKDTIVGNRKIRGISGGEKKRLSIACELISNPKIIFADEPTSGLDSFQAESVMESLKRLSQEGHTVIAVIHQPSGNIFSMLDDLYLLSEGMVIYSGAAKDAEKSIARYAGLKSRSSTISSPEYLLSIASIDYSSKDKEMYSRGLIEALSDAHLQRTKAGKEAALQRIQKERSPSRDIEMLAKIQGYREPKTRQLRAFKELQKAKLEATRPKAPFHRQFALLFKRAYREVARNKAVIAIKAAQQITTALVYGGIFSFSNSSTSIQDRFGLISLVAIGALNLNLAGTVRSFLKEKEVVDAERTKNTYSVFPFSVLSLLFIPIAAEAPLNAVLSALFGVLIYPLVGFQPSWRKFSNFVGITTAHSFASSALGLYLGAVAKSTDTALALMPPLIILQAVFNGVNIAEENTPRVLRWIPKVSLVRWCFEGLAVNEFEGLEFERPMRPGMRRPGKPLTGDEALERVSIVNGSVKRALLVELGLLGFFYIQTLGALLRGAPKFATMEHIVEADAREIEEVKVVVT